MIQSEFADPEQLPDEEEFRRLIEQLGGMKALCTQIKLPVSTKILSDAIREFHQRLPKQKEAHQRMGQWFRCFEAELESAHFMLVLPHRTPYWTSSAIDVNSIIGSEIDYLLKNLANFQDAQYDAREAGNCFAFERFTACVYHLMRVAEHGLVCVARSIGVPEEKISKGWDGCIQGIESEIKRISSTKPTADWQEQTKKYNSLCSWFATMKVGWRNPVSHVPRTYDESKASSMFGAVRTLFEDLHSQGFSQTMMPREPLPPPRDD
jgi:hypothetical protein